MKYTYNKLIRDNNVKIIEELGHKVTYSVLSDKEYIEELNKKVLEEANEFIEENDPEELGDLLEVVYAIAEYKNIDLKEVEKIRLAKKERKGAFKKRIYLKTVIEEDK